MKNVYDGINAHMEEMLESPVLTKYINASAAQGKSQSFLSASAKMMAIGAVAGAVIGLGLWFLSALAPEFVGKADDEKDRRNGKEAVKA